MLLEISRTDSHSVFAVLAMMFLTFLAYRAGGRISLKSKLVSSLALLLAIAFTFLLAWSSFGRLVWAEAIQSSSAVFWSNVTAPCLAFTAGLAIHAAGIRRRFRPTFAGFLLLISVSYVAMPIARPVLFPLTLQSVAQWKQGVCLQSHGASCAPAAAVTLLHCHGLEATEAQLSSVCLSSRLGTAPLGLYRGLNDVAAGGGFHAKVAGKDPAQWSALGQLPNVALVQFESLPGYSAHPEFLGSRVAGHVVTVLGRTDGGRWLIGDPAIGKVSWSDEEFRKRFTGEAIYLTK